MGQEVQGQSVRSQPSFGAILDRYCDEFESLWRQKRCPRLEDYLDRVDEENRARLLRELLLIEIHYRRRRGELPSLDEYLTRFSEDHDLLRQVFAESEASSCSSATIARQPGYEPEQAVAFETRCSQLEFHDKGGLGEVYRARDARLARAMALKFIHWSHLSNVDACERFLVEVEVTSRLDHPGVVPVYGVGEGRDGRPFYAMRFIEGQNLRKAIDGYHSENWRTQQHGAQRLELRRLLEHLIAACDTVAYAHNRGVVHRDIKPENIMLGKYGETLVVDWGLAQFVERDPKAKASGEETLMPEMLEKAKHGSDGGAGTVGYISPEQLPGSTTPGGPASDVYSLGATLYKLLTGQPPFHASDGSRVWDKIRSGDFPRPSQVRRTCPPALEAICLKAMSLHPQQRYATASDLAADLRRWMADEPVSCYQEPLFERFTRCARRHRSWSVALATAAAFVLLAAVATAIVFRSVAREQQRLRVQSEQATQEAQAARIANLCTTAAFAAKSYGFAIDNAWQRLELLAADPRLRELLLEAAERQEDSRQWPDLQNWLAAKTTDHLVEGMADCWFINDSRGIQVARNPVGDTIGQPFHDRSYFHGGDVDLDLAAGAALPPASHPTVSAAYRSRTDKAHRVAFSVPIQGGSGEAEPPLGMLAMSVPLHRFTKHSGLEVGEQMELALIDLGGDTLGRVPATGLILEHPHLGEGDVVRVTDTALLDRLQRLRQLGVQCAREQLGEQAKARIAAQMQTETIDRQFIDPIVTGEPPTIAAFWPVITVGGSEHSRDAQWVVVIKDCAQSVLESSEAGSGLVEP
jgi:serine/threonine-protein kinase